jgi:S-DNA-T family DNA segregation ATPase FtsK/SpoIIIE
VLVIGAGGAGKSGAVAALASVTSTVQREVVPSTVPAIWDALSGLLGETGRRASTDTPRLLLIDDLDSVVAACQEEYLPELLDRLSRVLREGPALGCRMVLTVQRVTSQLHSTLALCGSTLLLRMPNRTEYLAAGGESSGFDPGLPPGGGHWQGTRVQVFDTPTVSSCPEPPTSTLMRLGAGTPFAVVTSHPRRLAERLTALGSARPVVALADRQPGEPQREVLSGTAQHILVADVDTWQSHWSLLAGVRRSHALLFDGCSPADVRALTRRREVPPPFGRGERPLWLLEPDGELLRAHLDA